MQNASFAKLLREAVDRGQVVLIPGPDRPPSPPAPPLLRDRDPSSLAATLCLMFRLRLSEGRMLVALMTQDYSGKDTLRIAASLADQMATIGTMKVLLSSLRKKLARHDIRVSNIPGLGYGIDTISRGKIRKLLAEHDRTTMPSIK